MKVLAIEGSGNVLSVALRDADRLYQRELVQGTQDAQGTHPTEFLLELIEQLLHESGLTLHKLDGLAFGCGPGAFTSLRVICAAMQGLVLAVPKPVVAISSLAALAWQSNWPYVYVCVDARMQQIYCASYRRHEDQLLECMPAIVIDPQSVPLPQARPCWGVGNAFSVYRNALIEHMGDSLLATDACMHPHAVAVAQLALTPLMRGESLAVQDIVPHYVRNKVALTLEERQSIALRDN